MNRPGSVTQHMMVVGPCHHKQELRHHVLCRDKPTETGSGLGVNKLEGSREKGVMGCGVHCGMVSDRCGVPWGMVSDKYGVLWVLVKPVWNHRGDGCTTLLTN